MENEIDVNAIVAEATAPQDPITPASDAVREPLADTTEKEPAPNGDGRSLTYKGEDISMDDDKYKNYAQKGWDYEHKMRDFLVEKNLFEKEREQSKEKFSNLAEIDAYAKANPAWLRTVQDQWALIQSGKGPQMAPETEMQVMRSQMSAMQETLDAQKTDSENRRTAALEADTETSISKYKSEHSTMDWGAKDENGLTLEDRIGHAMLKTKTPEFKVMADSFLFKEHMDRQKLQGKESVAKDIQKANKAGLGKVTKTSQLGVKKATDTKKSYHELGLEALEELGL